MTIAGVPQGTNADNGNNLSTTPGNQLQYILYQTGTNRLSPGDTVAARSSMYNVTGMPWVAYFGAAGTGSWANLTNQSISSITNANPAVFTITSHGFHTGEGVALYNIVGMNGPLLDQTLNGYTYLVQVIDANTFTLTDLLGNPVNTASWTAYTGSGTANAQVIVQPDVPLGYTIGGITWYGTINPNCVPLTFNQVNFWVDTTQNGLGNLVAHGGGSKGCEMYENSMFSTGQAVSAHMAYPGMLLNQALSTIGPVTVDHTVFHDVEQAVSFGNSSNGAYACCSTVTWNTIYNDWYDVFDCDCYSSIIAHNFSYNKRGPGGAHQDFISNDFLPPGWPAGGWAGNTTAYNITVKNNGTPGVPDTQGAGTFGWNSNNQMNNLFVSNNIGFTSYVDSIHMNLDNNPLVQYNTAVTDITAVPVQFYGGISNGSGGAGTKLTVTSIVTPGGVIDYMNQQNLNYTGCAGCLHLTAYSVNGAANVIPGGVGDYTVSASTFVAAGTLMTIYPGGDAQIKISNGTNATVNQNVTNATSITPSGTITTIPSLAAQTIGATSTAYNAAFAGWTGCCSLTTRAAVIAAAAPKAGVLTTASPPGMENPGPTPALGTYNGALFPANNYGEICWNDGTVFNAAVHCTPAQ